MLLLLIGSIFAAIYSLTVPLIKENVFGLELHSNRQVLNIVYDLAKRIYFDSETDTENILTSHKQRLQSVLDMTEHHIRSRLNKAQGDKGEKDQAWQAIFQQLRGFQFGNQDYLWVADYDAVFRSHPADEFHGRHMADYQNPQGDNPLPRLLELARRDGEGFYKYQWNRLSGERMIDKYSYIRDFPEWGLIIGAGVYIDDIEQEVRRQKQQAIEEISRELQDIQIAGNGYLYIFDSQGNMLFHPNTNIHGKNFVSQLNPVTKNPIYKDLMAVADTGKELYYHWDQPADPGNYVYEKLSLVRHLPGFDWYISSSVYLDDLKSSSVQLSQRIMAMGLIALLAAVLTAFLFAEWISSPIKKLSSTAYKISRGNLSAKTGIRRSDELGLLAESFDYMVDRLRENIDTLNSRVRVRTKELSASNQRLRDAVESLQATENELRAAESRQRQILDALPAQIAYMDRRECFVFANREYLEMFGQTEAGISGKALHRVIGQSMYEDIRPHIEQALRGEQAIYEYRLTFQGRDIVTRRTLLPLYDGQEVVGLLNLSIDITAERETEKRLAEAAKMKAVGQMSGGLAHDFNNLLTIILGNLLELQSHTERRVDDRSLSDTTLTHLAPAIRATRRGADLTRRLLAFSRRQALSPSAIRLEDLLDELLALLSAPLPENIRLHTQTAADTPPVYVDAAQLEDALVNLALNAADAMPNGGELSIQAKRSAPNRQGFDDAVIAADYVSLSIADSGHGFSDEALSNAFEPFYTTKDTGIGSGLGLSMVYGFVKQSRGYIRIANRQPQGSVIEILLPVSTEPCPAVEKTAAPPEDSRPDDSATSLVLLVEDNHDVRHVIRGQLLQMGFSVLEAGSGDEAQRLLDKLPALAGLVSDVVMPGDSSGYEVARAVRLRHADAFIVLMSGYSDTPGEAEPDWTLLQKPFDPQTLCKAIFPHKTECLS